MGNPSTEKNDAGSTESVDWFDAEVQRLRETLKGSTESNYSLLNASRQEMYDCLTIFFVQVRYLFSIATGLIVVSVTIVGFSFDNGSESASTLKMTSGTVLFLLVPLRLLALGILQPVYQLYVSAIIFAAQLHEAAGLATHWWFDYLHKYLAKNPKDKDTLVDLWMYDEISTYVKYKRMIDILAATAAIAGILLFLWAILV